MVVCVGCVVPPVCNHPHSSLPRRAVWGSTIAGYLLLSAVSTHLLLGQEPYILEILATVRSHSSPCKPLRQKQSLLVRVGSSREPCTGRSTALKQGLCRRSLQTQGGQPYSLGCIMHGYQSPQEIFLVKALAPGMSETNQIRTLNAKACIQKPLQQVLNPCIPQR